jgi:hypothetical protein
VAKIKIKTNEGTMTVLIKNTKLRWCNIFIEESMGKILLGSSTFEMLCKNLSKIQEEIRNNDIIFFKYKGFMFKTIINLTEPHASLVFTVEKMQIHFYCIDVKGEIKFIMSTTVEQFSVFIEKILKKYK